MRRSRSIRPVKEMDAFDVAFAQAVDEEPDEVKRELSAGVAMLFGEAMTHATTGEFCLRRPLRDHVERIIARAIEIKTGTRPRRRSRP